MYVLVVLSLIIVLVSYLLFKNKYEYWRKKGIPYPKPTFIVGNLGPIFTLQTTLDQLFQNIYDNHKQYKYVGFYDLWKPAILIKDAELVKDVLIKRFSNFNQNWVETEKYIDPVLGYNPFVLKGDEWKTFRSQLTPQFTSLKIKSMFSGMQKGCENLLEYIKTKAETTNSDILDVVDFSVRFTGDNVIRCGYGLEGKSFILPVPDSFKIVGQIADSGWLMQIKQIIGFFLPWLRKLFRLTFIGDPVPQMFRDLIMEAMKFRDENNIVRNDFLDFMRELRAKNSDITDDILTAHAFTFFLDGFETSALAMSYVLLELSLNLNIQTKARKEILEVLKKHKEISYDAVQEMEYLDNVLSETLRKRPIIKAISRVCVEECEFPNPDESDPNQNPIKIEKGTEIFIPVCSIQADHINYESPETFNPDRFRDENKGCFLGFGDGPRICLGRRFAIAQLKSGLATILSNYEIELSDKTKLPIQMEKLHFFNLPKGRIWLHFKKLT